MSSYATVTPIVEVAAQCNYAESSIRTLYLRTVSRYTDAGRPTTGRVALLLEMVADGLVTLPDEPRRAWP